jgi:hypothetical protein
MPRPKHALTAFLTSQVDFDGQETYSRSVSGIPSFVLSLPSFYAPAYKYRRLAFGSYGFGHTTLREPGDLRGTVVGRKGRYRVFYARGGEA